MRRYTANQGLFFPQTYMMNRFVNCQFLVLMEEAQYSKFGHQSRAELFTKNGHMLLKVPLKDRNFKPLCDLEVVEPVRTLDKIYKTLQTIYGRFPGWAIHHEEFMGCMHEVFNSEQVYLNDLNLALWQYAMACAECEVPIIASRDIVPCRPDDPSEWVAEFGWRMGATEYLSGGTAAKAYLKDEHFSKYGMKIVVQNYTMPPYKGVAGMVDNGEAAFIDPLFVSGKQLLQDLIYRDFT